MEEKLIDIDSVVKSKSEKLYRLLPRFVLAWLKRVIHQDDVNRIISENKDKMGLDFVKATLDDIGITVNVFGYENIPNDKKFVVVANHPLGGIDGMALMYAVSKFKKELVFPVNDILLNIENLKELFLPINKHGRNDSLGNQLDDAFHSDKAVLYFPAGLCSRKQKNGVCDLEWKKTFLVKARKYDRDIIPAFIDGHNSNFFYNLARLRTRLGIKVNIEMLFLVDEMFKQKNQTINITFGKPIDIKTLDKSRPDKELVKSIYNTVYSIKQ